MSDATYNGWTNYATWRVNLEILSDYCDSMISDEMCFASIADLSDHLRAFAEEAVTDYGSREGIAVDYAMAFMAQVNYDEIARHHEDELIASDDDSDDDDA